MLPFGPQGPRTPGGESAVPVPSRTRAQSLCVSTRIECKPYIDQHCDNSGCDAISRDLAPIRGGEIPSTVSLCPAVHRISPHLNSEGVQLNFLGVNYYGHGILSSATQLGMLDHLWSGLSLTEL